MIPAAIQIDLNPNLGQLGPLTLTWHGLFSVLGILAAVRLGGRMADREGIRSERIYDAAVWIVLAGLVGARLLFIWENYQRFQGHWLDVIKLNEGGISQWGGIFGAILGAYLWGHRHRISFWRFMDGAGPAAMIGLAIGRIGDIINGEHHGSTTNLPWGVEYVNSQTLGQPGLVVHPEVAYELIWCLVLLALVLSFYDRLKARLPDGVTGLGTFAVYATGRFLLSFMRLDSTFLGLRQAQWASLVMIVFALLASYFLIHLARQPQPAQDNEPASPTPPTSVL